MGGGDPQADNEAPLQVIDIPIEDLSSEFQSTPDPATTLPGGDCATAASPGVGNPLATESRIPSQQPELPSNPTVSRAEAVPLISQQTSGDHKSSSSSTSLRHQDEFHHPHDQNSNRRSRGRSCNHHHHHHREDEHYRRRRNSMTQATTSSAGDHSRQAMHQRNHNRSRRSGYNDYYQPDDEYCSSSDEDEVIRGTIIRDNIIEVDPSKVTIGEGNRAGRRLRGRISGNVVLP